MRGILDSMFDQRHWLRAYEAMPGFSEAIARMIEENALQPTEGSAAALELADVILCANVLDAHCAGWQSVFAAHDHFAGLHDLVTDPVRTMAPATCVRGLVESAAVGSWLLDPSITGRDRVGRYFAFWYEGAEQRLKIVDPAERPGIIAKVERYEQQAIALGFQPRHQQDRPDKRTGIAVPWPGPTQLVADFLKDPKCYRLLSGIAHGHHWALLGFGMEVESEPFGDNPELLRGRQFASPQVLLYLSLTAYTSLAKLVWAGGTLYGWDQERLQQCLRSELDKAGLTAQLIGDILR